MRKSSARMAGSAPWLDLHGPAALAHSELVVRMVTSMAKEATDVGAPIDHPSNPKVVGGRHGRTVIYPDEEADLNENEARQAELVETWFDWDAAAE